MRHLFFAVLLILAQYDHCWAEERAVVTWAIQNAPPIFITGEKAGSGYGDGTYRYFFERMPEFQHRVETLPIARTWEAIAQNDGVCYGFARKTAEREGYAVFSQQVYWLQPYRLMIRKADVGKFARFMVGQAVDLPALVAAPALSGGVLIGRAYGPGIDKVIEPQRAKAITDGLDMPRLLTMLVNERLDWVIAYPTEGTYFARAVAPEAELISLAIAGSEDIVPAYFMCSKGPLGRRVIAAVDRVIAQAGKPSDYFLEYTRWLDEAARAELLPLASR